MDLNRLRSFKAIWKEGNLTRAAERLHLSQSALSSQIKQLEEELGVRLFTRTARGMELSEDGRDLLHEIDDVLSASERLRLKARSLIRTSGETVTIGLNTDPGYLLAGALSRRLSLLHQDLNVVFLSCPTARSTPMLRQGQLDLSYRYGEPLDSDLQHRHLADVRLCIAIPTSLARKGAPQSWDELADLPWIWVENDSPPYEAVLAELQQRRLLPDIAVRTTDEHIVRELVKEGRGVAVLREDEARPLADGHQVLIWGKGWMNIALNLVWTAEGNEKRKVRAAREAVVHLWSRARHTGDEALARFCY